MRIVCLADDLHEMSSLIFFENNNNKTITTTTTTTTTTTKTQNVFCCKFAWRF